MEGLLLLPIVAIVPALAIVVVVAIVPMGRHDLRQLDGSGQSTHQPIVALDHTLVVPARVVAHANGCLDCLLDVMSALIKGGKKEGC